MRQCRRAGREVLVAAPAAVGAGIRVGGGETAPATTEEVRAAVRTEPSYWRRRGATAGEIAAFPPVDEAVGVLARLPR